MANDSVLEIQARADFSSFFKASNEAATSIEDSSKRITGAFDSVATAPDKLTFSTMEARHAAMGLSEDLGVHMPRMVSMFLSHLGGVGPALAMAFTPIAIIGVTKVLIDAGKEIFNLYENVVNLKSEFEALDGIEKTLTTDMIGLSNALISGNVRLTELSSGAIAGSRERVASLGMQITDLGKMVDVNGKQFKDLGTSAKAALREFLVPTQAADFGNTLKNVGMEIERVKKLMLNTDEESTEFKGLQESLRLLSSFYDALALKAQKFGQDLSIANAEAQRAIQAEQEKTQRQAEQAAREAARVQHEQIIAELNDAEKAAKDKTKVLTEEARENEAANKSMDEEQKKGAEELAALKIKLMRQVTAENNREVREQEALVKKLEAPWDRLSKSIAHSMTQTTMGLIEGTMTIQKAFIKLGDGILQTMVSALAKVLAQHLTHAIMVNVIEKSQLATSIAAYLGYYSTKLAASKTAAIAQGTTDAGLAGAAGYASVIEALPFPVNIAVAPGVAAEVIATTMGLAAFAAGTDYVPRTGFALLHEGEAVTPASQNRGEGGGLHVHFNVSAIDAPGVAAFFDQHGEKMARTLSRQVRRRNSF
jgi:flagellar biosynthesis GTPase FlhF